MSETDRKEGKNIGFYRICPLCGAALDPGERCDCAAVAQEMTRRAQTRRKNARIADFAQKKAAVSGANTDSGGVELR